MTKYIRTALLLVFISGATAAFAQTPQIVATLADTLQVDNGTPNQFNEGDVIRYKAKIKNTGSGAATNVQAAFPTPPPNTTMVAGSIKTSALAKNDNYTASYNTIYAGPSVLANDFGIPLPTAVISFGPSANPAATPAGNSGTTDAGGTVTVNTNGTFSYSPPANFTGNDFFKYIIGNGNLPNNDAIVTLAVGAKLNNDSYTVTGNTQLVADGYSSPSTPFTADPTNILANDVSNQPITAVAVTNAPTVNGGTISINTSGQFIYTPPRGFMGTDTYTYSAVSNGITATGTIIFTVSNMIWYVNNTYAGANGAADGESTRPYTDVATAESASAAGQAIYVHTGSGNTAGAAVLKPAQFLAGAGAFFTYGTLSIAAGTAPVLTGTVTLASNVNVTGFDMNTGAAPAILSTGATVVYVNIGNINVSGAVNAVSLTTTSGNLSIAGGMVTNTTGASFNVSGGTATLAYSGNITQAVNAPVLSVSGGHSGGTIVFSTGTINASNGTGLQFDNANGMYNFFGTTVLNGGDAGVDILNGSAGTFSFGTGVSISSPTNGAFLLSGGTAAVTFNGGIFETNNAPAIVIQNHSVGTVTFQTGSILISGGTGMAFTNCSSTYNFNGTTNFFTSTTSGIAITNSAGTFNFSTGTSITGGATVPRLAVSGGTASVNFNGSISQSGVAALVSVSAHSGGTLSFSTGSLGASNGTGLQFDNADGTYNFNGSTSLNGGDAGIDILNGSSGTFSFGSSTAITDPTNEAIKINASTANVTYSGTFSKTNNTANGILVSSETGGTIAINGSGTKTITNTTGNAVNLISNTGATINFSGNNLVLSTSSGIGFNATGGGTITVTGTGNTITSPTGTALNVNGTTIGAAGFVFQSISSASPATTNGINLISTGIAGGLTVTGTGSAASGGTISNKNGADGGSAAQGCGIYLSNCGNISLSRMDIEGCQNYGIRGLTVTGFTLNNSTVGTTAKNGSSTTADSEGSLAFTGEGSIRFLDLTGTCALNSCTLDNGYSRTLIVRNEAASAALNLAVTNCTINESLNSTNGGDPGGNTSDAFFMDGTTNSNMNLTVTGSTFASYRQFAIDTRANNSATMSVTITGSNFSNSNTGNVSGSGSLSLGGSGLTGGDIYVKFDIENNTFRHGSSIVSPPNNGGAHLVCGLVSGAGKFDGKFINNQVGVTGIPFSGAGNAADALRIFSSGNAGTNRLTGTTHSRFLVRDNTIKRYGEVGIQVNSRQGNSIIDATVLHNTINEPGTAALGAFGAIWVNSGALSSDINEVNIAIGSTSASDKNTMQDSDPNNIDDVFLDQKSCSGCASTLNLYRNGSTASGSGETLIRQILVDDNLPTLDLLSGFTNGSTIGVVAGLPPQAP